MRTNFYAMFEEAQADADAPSPFALARSRIPVAEPPGAPIRAHRYRAHRRRPARHPSLAPPEPQIVTQPDPATQQELADLRTRVESMDRLVSTHLITQPATNRLRSVLAALNEGETNDRSLANLLNTLAFDSSVNVRLTALEALYAHVDREPVRAGVINALSREPSPLVQVAMIDFVVASRDTQAGPALDRLSRNAATEDVVREAARRDLVRL
ncbi:MAG: hypothetical protein J6386_16395 [Candidatus Synoicihabitans palmerolidicus]|nr:hypothetical protein [Candidatus Synoicihabitans palmerolidicus]